MTATDFLSADAAPDGSRPPAVRLLDAMPDLQRAIPWDDRSLAWRTLLVPVAVVPPGRLEQATGEPGARSVVLGGIVFRNTCLRGRVATEIIGEGDVLDTHEETEPSLVPTTTEHVVHREATLAFLGERFAAAARRWPGLHDVVGEQLARQRRRASAHLAVLQMPRVEDRIVTVFSHFADRWGRVTPDGIVVDLPLTHELIGQMVGGRRPTVTLALAGLAESGALARAPDGTWLLAREVVAAR